MIEYWVFMFSSTLSVMGCIWIYRNHKLPPNPYSRLLHYLILVCGLSSIFVILSYGYTLATDLNCALIGNCLIGDILSTCQLFFTLLFIFLTLSFVMIPLYVVKFNGSIEAVDVRFILIISIPPALLAIGVPFKPGNIYIIVLNSLIFVSIIAMIVCCVQTWYILKVQQLERFDQLSRRTFLATEIYKQQGSLLMMRLSVSLALVISTVFVCQVIRLVILICYNVPLPSLPKDHLPNLAWMVLFISDTIANSFGLLIAFGIHNSFQQVRKFASLQQARKKVPVQQIIRQPRANPSSDTIVPSEEPNPPREVRQVNNQSSTLNELESSVRLGQIFEPLSEVSFRGRPLFDNIDTVPDNGQAHDFQPPLNLLDSSRII